MPRKPPNKKLAWFALTPHQKMLLQRERRAGRFGGITGVPSYFWVFEKGNQEYETSDGFGGAGYIAATQTEARNTFSSACQTWWNS